MTSIPQPPDSDTQKDASEISQVSDPLLTNAYATRLRAVSAAQRLLIWSILANLIANILAQRVLSEQIEQIYAIPVLAVSIFVLYCVFRLTRVLGISIAGTVIYMILMFIPLVGLITLLVLNSKATKELKQAGIKVGLFGARDLDNLPSAEGKED